MHASTMFRFHDVKIEWVCFGGDALGIRPEIVIISDVALVASDSAPTSCADATIVKRVQRRASSATSPISSSHNTQADSSEHHVAPTS